MRVVAVRVCHRYVPSRSLRPRVHELTLDSESMLISSTVDGTSGPSAVLALLLCLGPNHLQDVSDFPQRTVDSLHRLLKGVHGEECYHVDFDRSGETWLSQVYLSNTAAAAPTNLLLCVPLPRDARPANPSRGREENLPTRSSCRPASRQISAREKRAVRPGRDFVLSWELARIARRRTVEIPHQPVRRCRADSGRRYRHIHIIIPRGCDAHVYGQSLQEEADDDRPRREPSVDGVDSWARA